MCNGGAEAHVYPKGLTRTCFAYDVDKNAVKLNLKNHLKTKLK